MNDLKVRANWYDDFIGFFSPRAKNSRLRHKIHTAYLKRKYEGADGGRRTKGWNTFSTSANSETALGLARLRDRSRDLVRNNPYAARGIAVIANNVIGRGIVTQVKVDNKSEVNRREKNLNAIWKAWAGTTACDFDGVHNLAGLQLLIMRSVVESGEVLIRLRRTGRRQTVGLDGSLVEVPPIQLQVLESDFIASTRLVGRLPNGNTIIQGIEVDPSGRVVAYHLFQDHPGSFDMSPTSRFSTVRVPAEEILHPYRMDRPGQIRGVPWLAPVMLRLRDFDLFEDAQLKRQQCAAMFTAFVHDLQGLDEPLSEQDEAELGEKMEPGIIEMLPPGKDIKLANPPGAENYKEYTSVVLHSIASGLGVTFEALTGDLSQVNFSSARMGFLEMSRNVDTWRSNIMIQKFMAPAFGWFKEGLDLMGETTDKMRPVFTPPRREMIDPTKEVPAMKDAVRSGFKTLSEVVREGGHDPDVHFEEIAQDNVTLDRLQLVLDSDPRKTQNSGKSQETQTDPGENTPSDSEE